MANAVYLALAYILASVPSFQDDYHAQDVAADRARVQAHPWYQTEEFDYVVVGGGSAGSVIASRLSASGASVLVLERGSTASPLAAFPALYLYLAFSDTGPFTSSIRYPSVPQAALKGKSPPLFSPSVLGGGSSINAMMYLRGSPSVYDAWAAITGDPNWSWRDVLPNFKRSEDYHGVWSKPGPVDRRFHGVGGPLHIEGANIVPLSSQVFFEAARERGLRLRDFNADLAAGFSPIDFTMKKGERWSTWKAFLEPATRLHASNLHVYRYATATRIHFDNARPHPRAVGVTYTRHGVTSRVRAKREVIVSAGAFESARLLMLSGIGPTEQLAALGIEPKIDLPVGRYFVDHIGAMLTFDLNNNITFVPERDMTTATAVQYLTTGNGPLHNDFATFAYISSTRTSDPSWPDLQLYVSHQPMTLNLGTDQAAVDCAPRNDSNIVLVYLVRPDSVGSISLSSADPSAPLLIDPNYASVASDLPRLVEGIKFVVDLYENSEAYARAGGARLLENLLPPQCSQAPIAYRSEEYWTCVARGLAIPGIHFAGSCRMGKSHGDPKAVVDSRLRVLGTKGLRVADASVMPLLPNSNTNAATIMIAERASDFILRNAKMERNKI